MKKFFKKWGCWMVTLALVSYVAYDKRNQIASAAKTAGKWIGDKCGSCGEESEADADPEPESRRPYQGKYGNNNNRK